MSLTIASLNVRGLRENTKRREMFTWLRAKHFSIYMLQEVHCTDNTNSVWATKLSLAITRVIKQEKLWS